MANEMSGSIPEDLADDVPVDVDFTAMMARSQATLIMIGGMAYQANQDLCQKMSDLGMTEKVTPEPTQ